MVLIVSAIKKKDLPAAPNMAPLSPELIDQERNDFSIVWLSTPRQERHSLLRRLTGVEPKRSYSYDSSGTILHDLSLDEVVGLLGSPDWDARYPNAIVLSYTIGSIESDTVGQLLPGIAKRVMLWICIDPIDKRVVRIETTS